MSVDVTYQGLMIARGAGLRPEAPGVYVDTEGPMPVGTRLLLSYEGNRLEGRVLRINEGVGPGMVVVPAEGGELPRWITQVKPQAVRTVEIEAEPELDPAFAPPVTLAAPATSAPSEPAAVTRPLPGEGPAVEQQGVASVVPAASDPGPPCEATQEMAIPSLDEELKSDPDDAAPRETEKRSSKKKKPISRRR